MKKIINYSLIIFLVMYYVSIYLPSSNFIKEMSLYLFLALVTYKIIDYFYIKIMKRTEGKPSLQSFTNLMKVLVFGLVLLGIGFVQINDFKIRKTLYPEGCKYYDLYDNLIYQSLYSGECPKLENYQDSDDFISFSVNESFSGKYSYRFVDDLFVVDYNANGSYLEFSAKSNVEIHYDNNNRIENVIIKSSELIKVREDENDEHASYIYNSYFREVKNLYNEDSFESITRYGEVHDKEFIPTTTDVVHHEFDDKEVTTTRLYTVFEEISSTKQNINIYKESQVNGELSSKLIAKSTINKGDNDSFLYDIKTDIMVSLIGGIKANNVLTLKNNSIEFDLYEKMGSSGTNVNKSSWERIEDFDNVILIKRTIFPGGERTRNDDYYRYHTGTSDSVIIEGINIYEIKNTEYGKLATAYDKEKIRSPYYHWLDKPYYLFDYENNLVNSRSAGDVIYQKLPFFDQYYK